MIKLSELKQAFASEDTLTSVYLRGNTLETIALRDIIFTGPSAFRVSTTAGFILQDGYQGNPGDVWTQISPDGKGRWQPSPTNLQAAYEAVNTILTNSADGDLTFTGTESIVLDGDGYDGYIVFTPRDGSADLNTNKVWVQDGLLIGSGRWLDATALTASTTLQQAYDNGNQIITSGSLDVTIGGTERLIISATGGLETTTLFNALGDAYFFDDVCITGPLKYADGSEEDGYVLTSDAYGNAVWVEPVSDLQGAYETSNTLTTSATFGDLIITGTEKTLISTAGGLEVTEDAYFTDDAYMTGTFNLKDGSEGSIGDVLTSVDSVGRGSWVPLPAASSIARGTVSRESDSGEAALGALTWEGANAPTGTVITPSYRCVRVGNVVNIWFIAEFSTPNAGTSSRVSFELPAGCPTPTLWTGLGANGTITHGTGGLFTTNDGYQAIDQTNEVSLHHNSGVYTVSISTFERVENNYGSHLSNEINPIGFNAHITYFV